MPTFIVENEKVCFINISSVQFNCSVVSDSWRPYVPQHARLPCPSPTPEFTNIKLHSIGYPQLEIYNLKIRGNTGSGGTKLDCCSIYWSVKGKYSLKDLRSISEIWDNSGQKPFHDLIYSH